MLTPLSIGKRLSKIDGELLQDPTHYRSIVEELQYCTLIRPKITYAIKKLCQFLITLTNVYFLAVTRVLEYLRGTTDHGIYLHQSSYFKVTAYIDAD